MIIEKAKYSLQDIKSDLLTENKILFSEREMKKILQEILAAYKILKSYNLVHGDVSPNNILIGFDNIIKLCDFEHSYFYNEKITQGNEPYIYPMPYVNRNFLCPELFYWFNHLSYKHDMIRYDPFKSDIFSIGLSVLYIVDSNIKHTSDLYGLNDYNSSNKSGIMKMFNLGYNKFQSSSYSEYIDYINSVCEPLQKIIDQRINSITGYNSIKDMLKKMMKVNIQERVDIDTAFDMINKINLNPSFL